MNKEELLKEIMKLPKVETINSISVMNAINVDDLMTVIDRFDKVPDYNDLLKENEELKQQIIIMEKYFELIHNISFDYDGYNDVTGLKGVIDELNRLANLGRVCNTTEPIFASEGIKFNILLQKLSEQKIGDDKECFG